MNQIRFNRIKQILYPLLVYYIFYNVFYGIFKIALAEKTGNLFCLALAGLVTLIPIILIYKKSIRLVKNDIFSGKDFAEACLFILGVVALGVILNILITKTGLIEASKAYSTASSVLSDGSLPVKIACNCIIIPILEETLYRGIICGQLVYMKNEVFAIIISSFCFGILHLNIVQFLYAFIVGLALGFAYCKTKRLWVVVLAHGLTNLVVILFS